MTSRNLQAMEQQNDEMTDKLAGKVELLRKISINIGKEIEDQNTELDGLNDKSGNILESLGGTMKGLMGLATSGGTRPLLVKSVAMFGIFIVIYFFSSRYSADP
eukprot:CAMPEP_0185260544 /NCGR_PEP_ID=MMETSP1359-20130426/9130_1 /TAXON_ID=552665 /ORGANISM="Bigelowiella longifila, Strain CCMP242" /LENGTH=103 /DNA_ID=CAMNT_0027846855 /DNA_START=87 /DNA_END=398 /DNA_ORIENTATION=+